ncbi:hypothetical protein CLU81_0551 [Flavobacterium sp. 9]|uniref:hypothetical protein n=1 Tax=Flavobacterium sp. 9 TaxID=2035198 RepID=UPI000C184775|nr:hypothetical protein [Flavobacterium sp. 9]PIF30146.1 hypothetical protein CLU81_0551 [Flavobacterium sp. 9]
MSLFTTFYFLSKRQVTYYFLGIFLLISSRIVAQKDTIFYDHNWKNTIKDSAIYYRIKPIRIKTKKAIGYKIDYIDSLYVLNDYYLKNNKLQFEGYSISKDEKQLVGIAKWYDQNNVIEHLEEHNGNRRDNLAILNVPIIIPYVDYKNVTKNQFIGGFEFCLDKDNYNKLLLGVGFGITSYSDTCYGLPDLHLSYLSNDDLLFFKAGTSDRHAYALVGRGSGVMDLGLGYSYPYNKNDFPVIKGFTLGITMRLTVFGIFFQKFQFIQ